MPRTSVARVGIDGARGERPDDLGPASREPIGIGERDHRLRVGGPFGHHVLVDGDDDLGHVTMWGNGSHQLFGSEPPAHVAQLVDQCAEIRSDAILIDEHGDVPRCRLRR